MLIRWTIAILAFGALLLVTLNQRSEIRLLRQEAAALRSTTRTEKPETESGEEARPDSHELERLRREAGEVHRLRGEVTMLKNQQTTSIAPVPSPAEGESAQSTNPQTRMRLGQGLKREGKFAEALPHLLWAYDEGVAHSPAFVGVRNSFLLSELAGLAQNYPPAREALLARRDQAESAVLSGTADGSSVMGLVRLNETLGTPEKSLELYDRLPEGHSSRAQLADWASDQFLKTRRYQDLANSAGLEAILDREQFAMSEASKRAESNPFLEATLRRRFVTKGGQALEALAAVGQIDRAKAVVDRVLQEDPSPETRAQLQQFAERSGNPAITTYLQSR